MERGNDTARPAGSELQDAAKAWIAIDGIWFQEVERVYGMEAAIAMDCRVWEQFAVIESERIKKWLDLHETGGLDALEAA